MQNRASKILTVILGVITLSCGTKNSDQTISDNSDEIQKDTVYIVQKEAIVSDSVEVIESVKVPETGKNIETKKATPVDGTVSKSETKAVKTKKKMNSTTKGALIGAGAGAVTGVIVDKNHRGRGAVLGVILGAGAGAATGKVIEKKNKD